MKSVIEKLTPADRQLLALFYETPTHKTLTKLITLEREELARDALDQREISEVRWLNGGATKLKGLLLTIKEVYRISNKKG